MPSRHQDWLRQAERDLEHAQHSSIAGDYEWACFAAHQAAEKALKAVYQKIGAEAWGHSVTELLARLPAKRRPARLVDATKELDRHYIGTRYPSFHSSGAPADYYSKKDATRAINYAETILNFCTNILLS